METLPRPVPDVPLTFAELRIMALRYIDHGRDHASGERSHETAAGGNGTRSEAMKWTTEKPTRAGYYWLRYGFTPRIVPLKYPQGSIQASKELVVYHDDDASESPLKSWRGVGRPYRAARRVRFR